MLDRASTFSDKDIIATLKTRFIPVALDQAYQRRQRDTEGDFYRKIAGQGPRDDFNETTQGLYVAGPDGLLLGFSNHRGADRIKRMLQASLDQFEPGEAAVLQPGKADPRYHPTLPEGGLVIRVQAKVLDGYEATDNRWRQIFQSAVSRDNLWVTQEEHKALVKGEFPKSLQWRVARFHLVDNTRGEPPMWRKQEVRKMDLELTVGSVIGEVRLETASGDRGYEAQLAGTVEVQEGKVTRFDLVSKGDFWGEGRYTRNGPKGRFPLGISFTLADGSDIADGIPPQGSRGWVEGYLQDSR